MPPISENRLRVKGNEYFKNWEITAANEGTLKDPKFSLLKLFEDEIFPALDQLAVELETRLGKRIMIIFQWDNASPHSSKILMKYLQEEFKKRNWHIFPQPPRSPLSNVHDTWIFPSLSKIVSEMQNLFGQANNNTTEYLWKIVKKAFDDYPLIK